ncbi:Sec-independent protein translocase protein TatB [Mangrovicella endophytica]|uniref:Sec-independent protein translocase protein TatB n=1 Tax=Mangrovicella endophytica TaxID=2066697 RepID=UPI000C9E3E49|nr:Sec-independent protein translocase protein TatB [Mangrovicella endophytica]
MFEIGWMELLVIAVVLIVVVGPKDLPRMLRTFGRATSQIRSMAGDFRRQFDDALREAELDEVRNTVRDLNPAGDIRKALNPMKAVGDEIRSSLAAATRAPAPKVPSATAEAEPFPTEKLGSVGTSAVDESQTPHPAAVPDAAIPTPSVPVAAAAERTGSSEPNPAAAAPERRTATEDAA